MVVSKNLCATSRAYMQELEELGQRDANRNGKFNRNHVFKA